MTSNTENTVDAVWKLIKRIAFVLFFIIGGGYLLIRSRMIILSVLISILLTYMLLPSVEWLNRCKVKYIKPKARRLLATIIVFIVFFGIVALTIGVMFTPFKNEISQFRVNVSTYSSQLGHFVQKADAWYTAAVPQHVKVAIGRLDYTKLAGWVTNYAQRALIFITSSIEIALELVLIPVLAFYFLLDYRSVTKEIYGLVPKERRREAIRIGRRIGHILQSYVFGQLILCAIAGVLTGFFLGVIDLPYVLVLALFAGVTRAIPIIGPIVSGIPIVLVGVLNSTGLAVPFYLLMFIIIMHFAESKFIMPRLIGDRLHLHPAVVIVVLLIGAEFFGLIGMFLAAPVAAVIRDLIRFYYVRPMEKHVLSD